MTPTYIILSTSEQVTDQCLEDAAEIYDGWFTSSDVIDWNNFWDRLEETYFWTIQDVTSPAASKIKRHIRKVRNEY